MKLNYMFNNTSTTNSLPNLLCPICFNHIPKIQLIKENNQIYIHTFCNCNNKKHKTRLSQYNSLMTTNSHKLDMTNDLFSPNYKYCSNCLLMFCADAYDCHIQSCNSQNDDKANMNSIRKISIWYCNDCSINLCYHCTINENHKNHTTIMYTVNEYKDMLNEMIQYSNKNTKNNLLLFKDLNDHLTERINLLKNWKKNIEKYYTINNNINTEMSTLLTIINNTVNRSKDFFYNYPLIKSIQNIYPNNSNGIYNENHKLIPIHMKTIKEFSNDLDNKYHEYLNYFSNHYLLNVNHIFKAKEVLKFDKHNGDVFAIIQLSNGKIVLAANDPIINVFELTGKSSVLRGHTDFVLSLLELKDDRVASGSIDSTIKIWNCYTNQCIISLSQSDYSHFCLILLHNGKMMSSDNHMIRIWNVQSYKCIASINCHTDDISHLLQLSNDSIVTVEKSMRLWSNTSFSLCLYEYPIQTDEIFIITEYDNEHFAIATIGNVIKVFNSIAFQCVLSISMGNVNHEGTLIKTNNGELMTINDNAIFIWDKLFRCYKNIQLPAISNRIYLILKNDMIAYGSFLHYIQIFEL